MNELNRLNPDEYRASEKMPVTVVLDNVRSQNNIGSIFRTADAFRFEGLVLCGISATPPHREIHKTALGSEDAVPWIYEAEAADAIVRLKEQGYTVVAVEQAEGSILLQDFPASAYPKIALVFGNEIHGVSQEVMDLADACIEIPQFGTKHSINVAVTAGIVIWEVFRKRGSTEALKR